MIACAWFFIAVLSSPLHSQSNFKKGEDLFMHNKPAEAVVFLENAIIEDPANVTAHLYLGIAFEQLGKIDDAIATYRQVLPRAGNLSANVANNLGNVFFQSGNTEMAEQFYTQALSQNAVLTSAYLGRANTRIKTGNLQNAIADYERYLSLEPNSSQRPQIEQLVSLIRSEVAAEERRRLIAEEEARKLAEERQKLLDSVSASLQSVADYSQGLSSGGENLELYEGEFELE
jgi:tetratricopeptide (TPR) repeat protein